MAVTDPLDVTPEFTVTTIQFPSDALNGITTSLLTIFVIANIGSAISKLVYFSRGLDFHYDSWLRAFIFANSDDPLRILAWISRNYVYRKRSWHRNPNKLKLGRLVQPLLARGVIFIVSIVSIGITVPSTKVLSACSRGDYRLELNTSAPANNDFKGTACLDVPLESDRGRPRGKVSYCTCIFSPTSTGQPGILVNHSTADGSIEVILVNGGNVPVGLRAYVEWKSDGAETLFRSLLPLSITAEQHMSLALSVVEDSLQLGCAGTPVKVDSIGYVFEASLAGCEFPTDMSAMVAFIGAIESRVRHAMQWRQTEEVQPRAAIQTADEGPVIIRYCPLNVDVLRPVVNIVPLLIALVVLVAVNVLVSWIVSKHGNAFDAGFHLMKEVFGRDTTSNPLEENAKRDEVQELELRHWRCGAAGAHVGFWGRRGDIPVEDFTDDLIVCACARVEDEADYMSAAGTDIASFIPASLCEGQVEEDGRDFQNQWS